MASDYVARIQRNGGLLGVTGAVVAVIVKIEEEKRV